MLRPPPNRGFLQGYPGIPPSETRPPAHLSGTIEVQAGAKKPIEAAWLRVEMAKTETLPSGESWTELIGQGPMDVWTAEGGAHADGETWAHLPAVRAVAHRSAALRSACRSRRSSPRHSAWRSTAGSRTS